MLTRSATMLAAALIGAVSPGAAIADGDPTTDDVAPLFSYGGVLEHDGDAVSGRLTMTFKVYDSAQAASGTPIWVETQEVELHAGRFSVLLGECDGLFSSTLRCPMGDADAVVHLAGLVVFADDL